MSLIINDTTISAMHAHLLRSHSSHGVTMQNVQVTENGYLVVYVITPTYEEVKFSSRQQRCAFFVADSADGAVLHCKNSIIL